MFLASMLAAVRAAVKRAMVNLFILEDVEELEEVENWLARIGKKLELFPS